jgi:hypothetical protein
MKILALLISAILCVGCGSHTAALDATTKAQLSFLAGAKDMNTIAEALIQAAVAEKRARIDAETDAAIKEQTGADGKANAHNISNLERDRILDYAKVEASAAAVRAKIASANVNFSNGSILLKALADYWKQEVDNAAAKKAATDGALDILQQVAEKQFAKKGTTP